jgi:hypothetical protein
MRRSLATVAVWIPLVLVFVLAGHEYGAQKVHQPSSKQQVSLKKFLRDYLGKPYKPFEQEEPARYSPAWVDLADDEVPDVIVYLTGRGWCGTGGCVTLILAPSDGSYKLVGKITITRPPIRVLVTKSHDWHDIGVWVQGGGIEPGYEAKLSFDGKKYPNNPSVPPAKPLMGEISGKVVVSNDDMLHSFALYP